MRKNAAYRHCPSLGQSDNDSVLESLMKGLCANIAVQGISEQRQAQLRRPFVIGIPIERGGMVVQIYTAIEPPPFGTLAHDDLKIRAA